MKKVLLFLLLGIFCFSDNTLLNGIDWGNSKEDIISKHGKPNKIDKKKGDIKYYNLKLENINLDEVTFQFEENELVTWYALTKIERKESEDFISILKENSALKFSKKTFAGEEYKGTTEERTVILAVVDQAFWKKFLLMEFHKPE